MTLEYTARFVVKYKLPSSLETTASLELENFSKELAKDRLAVTLKKAPNH